QACRDEGNNDETNRHLLEQGHIASFFSACACRRRMHARGVSSTAAKGNYLTTASIAYPQSPGAAIQARGRMDPLPPGLDLGPQAVEQALRLLVVCRDGVELRPGGGVGID